MKQLLDFVNFKKFLKVWLSMAKWDSDGLLIQTRSVEKVLAPLVAQVSYYFWFYCLKYFPVSNPSNFREKDGRRELEFSC